jgi:hypothetical protein
MDQDIDITGSNVSIDVTDPKHLQDNFRAVLFQAKGLNHEVVSNLTIKLSDPNLKVLGEKLFPHGLMPSTFEEKLAVLNYLIKDIGPVYDNENPEYYISVVRLNKEEDRLYFDTEEDKTNV